MDRLICGDVGYGKTEVALRAAFKAAEDGRGDVPGADDGARPAALRHVQRAPARLPFRIDMVSRFRSPKEAREPPPRSSAARSTS